MSEAAFHQGVDIAREQLRNFLENTEAGRRTLNAADRHDIPLERLNGDGKRQTQRKEEDDVDLDDI